MQALTTKLFREIRHLRGQLIAIVVVIACGIANFVTFRSVETSLILTQAAYYDASQFADVFLTARRVPESVRERILAVPGVALVETRVVSEVMLDLPDVAEPASATILSIPENGQPLLNKLHLKSGRWVDERRDDEVIISTAFAEANDFHPGDQFNAVINTRWRRLTVVGTALQPEYILEMRPGTMLIDNKRYGILWMGRKALAAAFDMNGAFNSAVIKLDPGADVSRVKDEVDLILKPYGSIGAIDRSEQTSHRFLSDEIKQVQVQSFIVPTIFLGVAIFLLNIALLRLVGTQRMSIAILKSFGYSNTQIGMHYIGFALVAVLAGSILGLIGGQYLGVAMTELYARFYRFPVLRFDMPNGVIAGSMVLSAVAAVMGAIGAVRTVIKLPPAEAMRPEAPKTFKPGVFERLPMFRRLDPIMAMIWRNIERRPVKSAIGVVMIGLAMAILVIGRSMFDMFDTLMDVQFNSAMRSDAVVAFAQNRSSTVVYDMQHLPGVLSVETFRAVPVDLVNGQHTKRLAITSIDERADLNRVVDMHGRPIVLAAHGLTLTDYLAESLQLKIGDTVMVKLLEGDRRELRVPLSGTVSEMFGVQAYMPSPALNALLREQGSVSGAYVLLDPGAVEEFSRSVKATPAVSSVMVRKTAIQSFNDNYRENMDISTFYMVLFAVIIAFGVVYNSARIALSERATELASLRILGLTSMEITIILLGEQMILTLLAIPVGAFIGSLVVLWLPTAFASDLMRFPAMLTFRNFGLGVLTITSVALLTGVLLRRRLRKLDLIAVLKSRE